MQRNLHCINKQQFFYIFALAFRAKWHCLLTSILLGISYGLPDGAQRGSWKSSSYRLLLVVIMDVISCSVIWTCCRLCHLLAEDENRPVYLIDIALKQRRQSLLPFRIYHYRQTLAKSTLLSALDLGSGLQP